MRISTPLQYLQHKIALLERQTDLNQSIEKLSSGKKVTTAGDDPIAAVTIENLKQYNVVIDQYQSNITDARYRMGTAENNIASMEEMILRVRDLMLQGNNGTLDKFSRGSIAYEIERLYDNLMSLANSKDESNNFVFAGFKTNLQPFGRSNINGLLQYDGDSGERISLIDDELTTITNIPGDELITKAPMPTEDFKVAYQEESKGDVVVESAIRSTSLATNIPVFLQDQYEFTFSQPPGIRIDWLGGLTSPAVTTNFVITDTAGERLVVPIPANTDLDPTSTAAGATTLRALFDTALAAAAPAVQASFKIEGQDNGIVVKHKSTDEVVKGAYVSDIPVTGLTGASVFPVATNVEVSIRDINDAEQGIVVSNTVGTLSPVLENDLTFQLLSFTRGAAGSSDDLQLDFTLNDGLGGAETISTTISSNIQSMHELSQNLAFQLNLALEQSVLFSGVRIDNTDKNLTFRDGIPSQLATIAVSGTPNPVGPSSIAIELNSYNRQLSGLAATTFNMGAAANLVASPKDPFHLDFQEGDGSVGATDVTVTILGEDPVAGTPNLANFEMAYDLDTKTIRITEDSVAAPENFFTLRYQGYPENGDVMAVKLTEDPHVNIFDAMKGVIDILRDNTKNDKKHVSLNYGRLISELDSGREHLTTQRAELGIRLNQIDLIEFFHQDLKFINTKTLSPLEDLDYGEAVTEFSQQEVALKALSATFSKVAGMSLFDYL
jgi:flagellin-like hook-associated protein FlgL